MVFVTLPVVITNEIFLVTNIGYYIKYKTKQLHTHTAHTIVGG